MNQMYLAEIQEKMRYFWLEHKILPNAILIPASWLVSEIKIEGSLRLEIIYAAGIDEPKVILK